MSATDQRPTVLFLCTGNSARSQLAEALLRHLSADRFVALSAGTRPAAKVHPLALAVLEERGIPTDGLTPKTVEAIRQTHEVDHLITVCAAAAEACPISGEGRGGEHWPIDDPAAAVGSESERLDVFRATLATIEQRLRRWLEQDHDRR